jgi:tetratricopeptide (TPR) repeat protein
MKASRFRWNASALVLTSVLAFCAGQAIHAVEQENATDPAYQLEDSNSLLGSYLAGRVARSQRDNETAARYYREALDRDPASKEILEDAFQLKVATGKFPEARQLAKQLTVRDGDHKIANLFLGLSAFHEKDYRAAENHFKAVGKAPIAELTANLSRMWTEYARGQINDAVKSSSAVSSPQTEGSQHIELLHRALIADLAKKRNISRQAYQQLFKKNPRNVRAVEAYARHAAFWGDKELAEKVLKPHLSVPNPNPLLKSLADDIAANKKITLVVTDAKEGLAEVFQGIGEALAGDGVIDAGQLYLQLALFVRSDFTVAQYALGELYDQLKNYEQANSAFDRVPRESPLWLNAQLRKAYDLNSLERIEEAKTLLVELIKAFPDDMRSYYTMGNLLRGNKEYAPAIEYYTKAIEKLGPLEKTQWSVYYARGVCYERVKEWPKAEADLRKALDLDPNQELTLNYLGYSWVDQSLNLKEAMDLIRRAVQLRPNDGYFVDSLGWAYYRQKDFEQAVKQLERAVELKPDDPVINDHLGDAYWHVGRRLEAKFQWKQALDLKPEADDEAKIKKKLEAGLIEEPAGATRASLDGGLSGAPAAESK